jgi:uncharacterized protein (DUF433 family)
LVGFQAIVGYMSKTVVMTLRLPESVNRSIQRLAARLGHKPAQLGARLVEEGVRRREFPLIDFRETASGRMAYVRGSRLAVYWIVEAVRRLKGNVDKASKTWDLPVEKVRAALHYAEAFPEEIQSDIAQAEANRASLEKAESSIQRAKELNKENTRDSPKARG